MSMWKILPLIVSSVALGQSSDHDLKLHHVIDLAVPGGVEILSFDPHNQQMYASGSNGVMVFEFERPERLSMISSEAFSQTDTWEATSIAVDPAGRGFVACAWIPHPTDRVPGMVQILDTESQQVLWQFSAGYHPDCVVISPDGRYLITANECEPGEIDRAGGISIVNIEQVQSASDFVGMNAVQTYDFRNEHLGNGVTLDDLRISSSLRETPWIDIEPEYLAPTNDGVWVVLQENNGLAYFDYELRKWTRVQSLHSLSFPFDASDRDGVNIAQHAGVALLPQPDTVSFTELEGQGYVILANEGEKDDADSIRYKNAVANGLIDSQTVRQLAAESSGDQLDRLMISTIDGDLDGDGDIDVPTALGGRSISILDAETGSLVWNSGEQIEVISSMLWPDRFNSADSRSDRAGPEPEGLAHGTIGKQTLLFVGLERTGAILMYDISNPESPKILDAQLLNTGCSRPEGLSFYTMNGLSYLAVASEVGGCLSVYQIR